MAQPQKNDELQALVDAKRWEEAKALCRSQVNAGVDAAFCKLQLGLVLFLMDEFGNEAWAQECIEALDDAVSTAPDDADAYFWLGYALAINDWSWRDMPDASRRSVAALERCLALNPSHPYAHLSLASGYEQDREHNLRHLGQVVDVQPCNLRALRQMFDIAVDAGERGEADDLLRRMELSPHIESGYGLMNDYVNRVFIGGPYAETSLRECRLRFEACFE